MSQNVEHVQKSTVVPYVGMERIIELLKLMYKNSAKEKKLDDLAVLLGCKISNLNNVTPTLAVLELGEVRKGVLALTPDGLVCADAFLHDDYEKAKITIRKNLEKSEALAFTKSLLETRTTITGDEIGRSLSERFNKNWKNIQTTKNFGNSCASIVAFAGFGHYYDGVLSTKPPTVSASSMLYAPEANYTEITNILNACHGFERAKISEIANKAKQKESASSQTLAVSTILGLVEKLPNSIYSITDIGRTLIDPLTAEEEKQKIFRDCLLKSKYKDIIEKISKYGKEFTMTSIGEILNFNLQRNWSDSTKEVYGKKFGNWLVNAGLVEKTGTGKYTIKSELLQTHESIIESKSDEKHIADLRMIFEIGRSVGSLESIILEADDKKFFSEKLAMLKGLLEQHEDLKLTLDMLDNNFEVAKATNNSTVYQSNISFVRNKIKERLVGRD